MTSSAIVGAGMTPFGKHVDTSLKALGAAAVHDALADAGVTREQVDMAFVANAMASIVTGQVSVVGQTILREDGFAGTPVYNVDNACAGSSTALNLAAMAIAAGTADTVLVLGVEKLFSDRRERAYLALNGAADQDLVAASGIDPANESVFVTAVYPQRLKAYADRYGLERETLARIAVKNRRHAALNPLAQYTKPVTVEDVLGSWMVADPVTALMCAPIGDGAAAVVLTRAELAREDGRRPVWLRGSAIGMGGPGAASAIQLTATLAYEQAEIEPRDVDVASGSTTSSATASSCSRARGRRSATAAAGGSRRPARWWRRRRRCPARGRSWSAGSTAMPPTTSSSSGPTATCSPPARRWTRSRHRCATCSFCRPRSTSDEHELLARASCLAT